MCKLLCVGGWLLQNLLDRCLDDIEKFVARLQQAASAFRKLEKRRVGRKHSDNVHGLGGEWTYTRHHHHHHRQPWAQCLLMSDAILTIAAHRCLSRAAWLNSCRVAPHHCSMSSDHSRCGRPLLFEPSIIPNTRVFIFLLSFILQIWPKRRNFLCIAFCSRVSAN